MDESARDHDQDGRLLATPELDVALAQFFSDALDARMAEDPLFGRLRRLQLPEGVTGVSVEVDQSGLKSPSVPLEHADKVMTTDLVEGNFEELHRVILEMATEFLEQYMPAFFEHLEVAVESVGNSVDLAGEELTRDHILDSYEKTQWAPDAHGIVRPPQIHAGTAVAAKIEALSPWTAAQRQRFIDMWERKQEEHVSRRRSRRLRDEPDGA